MEGTTRLTCVASTRKFAGLLLLFLKIRFAHDRGLAKCRGPREAGVNPALPRNCKRGQCNRPLGQPGKANCGSRMVTRKVSILNSQSQETGVNRPHNPFAR
jgi:hypothetical protein